MGKVMVMHVIPSGGSPPPGSPTYITDQDSIYQSPLIPRPSLRETYIDPVFGTNVTKITDISMAPPGSNPGHNGTTFGVLYEYARQVPMSKDGTYIYVVNRRTSQSGDGEVRRVSDGTSMTGDLNIANVESEWRWSTTDDNVAYFMRNNYACKITMPSGIVEHLFTVKSLSGSNYTFLYTDAEGGPDDARHYQALMGKRTGYATEWVLYDIQTGLIRKQIVAPQYANWVSTTPLTGQFIIGGDASTNHSNLYDQDLNFVRRVSLRVSHGDLAIGSDGKEYYVYLAQDVGQVAEAGGEGLVWCRLDDGSRAVVPGFRKAPRSAIHISGICSRSHPDWVLLSHYTSSSEITKPGHHEIWFQNFITGAVKRIAHTHNYPDPLVQKDYWSETQATCTWDATKVLFKSNWGTVEPNVYIETYMITGNFWI
jgi:hypothetical protein